jgi:hypothetical protein
MSETYDYLPRTRVFDPAFANETTSFEHVPTKEYADKIFPNITDVRNRIAPHLRCTDSDYRALPTHQSITSLSLTWR